MPVAMKLAFSNAACAELDFDTLVAKSKEWGYSGFELKFLDGTFDLTAAPSLRRDPETLRSRLAAAGQTLVALNTSLSFCDRSSTRVDENRRKVREYIDLAARIGCPYVIVAGDVLPAGMNKARALEQMRGALSDLAQGAAAQRVTILLENIGDFASSRDMWMIHDAVRFPSFRICWNQLYARMLNEPASVSLPRLGKALGMLHVSDAKLNEQGLIDSHVELGKGQIELVKMIELLRGLAYEGWLCVEWPRLWQPSLGPADKVLPAAAKALRGELDKKPVELTAYKGDKNAPRFRGPTIPAVPTAK